MVNRDHTPQPSKGCLSSQTYVHSLGFGLNMPGKPPSQPSAIISPTLEKPRLLYSLKPASDDSSQAGADATDEEGSSMSAR